MYFNIMFSLSLGVLCFAFQASAMVPPSQSSNLTNTCQCGVPSDTVLSMRIVGGRRAEPHSYPWTVAIVLYEQMHCGGAIITDRHVLSAGHCFQWSDYKTLQVLIGMHDISDLTNVEKRNISGVVIHENFTSTDLRDDNDIAIAKLDRPVKFSETIIPICLPERGQDFSGLVATIVGWGRVGVNDRTSDILLKARLNVMSDEQCTSMGTLKDHLTPNMMCASFKGRDGCQGDSGGPLLVFDDQKFVQAGVVSWGIGCANPMYPGIYTNVSNYIDWIHNNSDDGLTCNGIETN